MFTSPTCKPCSNMKPLLANLQSNTPVMTVLVDITQFPILANTYRVRALPTLMFFKDQRLEDTFIGSMNYQRLLQFVKE